MSTPRRTTFHFDVFIPSLSLALEYNGEYHYQFVPVYLELTQYICTYAQPQFGTVPATRSTQASQLCTRWHNTDCDPLLVG